MPPAPPSDRELDAYREQADRFIAELDEEFYLHYAGHKDTFDLSPIYERHRNLTDLDTVKSVGLAVNGGARVRELWRFACEGYFGELTRDHAERLAALESEVHVKVDGEEIPYRMIRPALANEPDRGKRERLDSKANEVLEERMNPLHLDAARTVQRAAQDLGFDSYLELYRKALPSTALDDLAAQCRAFLDSTERLYEDAADRLFRNRVGLSLAEAQRWDVPRLFRAPEWDPMFPKDKMVPALEGTLADLGIDLKSQDNVHLDLEERPNKTPRAFCAPIEIPDKVMLVIQPIGGPDDWRALFHEAGHTEHFANTSRELAMEEKRLGDNAVTEGWAMLLQHLTDEPEWLSRLLDFPRPKEYAVEGATGLLFFVRRYCAKIRRRAQDRADVGQLPRGHRLRLLRLLVPPLMGVRGTAAVVPEGEVRDTLVHHSGRRLAPARAVGRGPEDACRGDAQGGDRLHPRDGGRRRARPRSARLAPRSDMPMGRFGPR